MTDPIATIRAFSCTRCGGTISLRAAGSTVSLVCEHCGVTLDATDPDLRMIADAQAAISRPEIPLGKRAELRGQEWEVVGYIERSGGGGAWIEYLLFNPYAGYAFLVDDGRRFHLGKLLDKLPQVGGDGVISEGETFTRDSAYQARVNFVVGEFYWRVTVGELVRVTDYARPGAMLSCEENASERTWTRLDLLDRGEAEEAFGIHRHSRFGVPGPDEPSPWARMLKEASIIAAAALLVLLAVLVPIASRSNRVAAVDSQTTLDGPEQTVVIHNIDLARSRNRVQITADAPQLDNNWIDIDYSFVDQKTQASYDAYALAEFYRGSDGDGPWTEGERQPMIALASIPGGRYDLVITVKASRWRPSGASYESSSWTVPEATPISFQVDTGGVFGGNIVVACLLILAWPALLLLFHYNHEKNRG